MKKNILFAMMIGVVLTGCSSSNDVIEEETSTAVEMSSTIETSTEIESTTEVESTIEEETTTEEESSTEIVLEDGITFYDYGYLLADDISVSVTEDKTTDVVSSKKDNSYFKDFYKLYYWIDKNTKIVDSTTCELKENIPAFLLTESGFDNRWEYIMMFDNENNLVNSSYDLRMLKVSVNKDNEQFEDWLIMCIPKDSLIFRKSIESGEEISEVLVINSKDNSKTMTIDLNEVYEKELFKEPYVCGSEDWQGLVVQRDTFLESQDLYTALSQFYLSAKIEPPIDWHIVTPLDVDTFNTTVLNSFGDKSQPFIDSVVTDGLKYQYVIFTYEDTTYETCVVSDKDIIPSNLDFKGYISKTDSVYKYTSPTQDYAWCDWSTFIGDSSMVEELTSYVKAENIYEEKETESSTEEETTEVIETSEEEISTEDSE